MKKHILLLIVLILSLAACTVPPVPTETPAVMASPSAATLSPAATAHHSPTATANHSPIITAAPLPKASPSPVQSVSPDEEETGLLEGSIPNDISANGYTPDSDSGMYEDEDYIIFRSNGILVFDKNVNETHTVLPRSNAFTYYDKNVYYVDYNAETKKSSIIKYSVASGGEKMILQMDNTINSMLAYDGRLYYEYQTDPRDAASTELRSVALDGGDIRTYVKGIDHYIIKDGFVYYSEELTMNHFDLNLYKLNLKDGSKVSITRQDTNRYPFKIIGDTLLYPADNNSLGLYDIKTGSDSYFPVDAEGWGGFYFNFTILGRYIIMADESYFIEEEPAYVRAYNLDTGKLYNLAESDQAPYYLHTTKDGVYIYPDRSDRTSQLFKVVVSGGKVSLKEIINYTAPGKTPSSDTVIFVSGGKCGGYSGGKWLTESEAADYLQGGMTFSMYNLVEFKGTVVSTIDENDRFRLNISRGDIYDYAKDPLCFSYAFYGGKLPDIEVAADTSEAKSAIQSLLDSKLGEGKAEANIRIAVNADIDNDGEKETVVNADWVSGYFDGDGPDDGDCWYCLSCIIESDGTVKTIDDYYFVPTEEELYPIHGHFFYVQNIIDLDGDGISELVLDGSYSNDTETSIYRYDGNNVNEIMHYYMLL